MTEGRLDHAPDDEEVKGLRESARTPPQGARQGPAHAYTARRSRTSSAVLDQTRCPGSASGLRPRRPGRPFPSPSARCGPAPPEALRVQASGPCAGLDAAPTTRRPRCGSSPARSGGKRCGPVRGTWLTAPRGPPMSWRPAGEDVDLDRVTSWEDPRGNLGQPPLDGSAPAQHVARGDVVRPGVPTPSSRTWHRSRPRRRGRPNSVGPPRTGGRLQEPRDRCAPKHGAVRERHGGGVRVPHVPTALHRCPRRGAG